MAFGLALSALLKDSFTLVRVLVPLLPQASFASLLPPVDQGQVISTLRLFLPVEYGGPLPPDLPTATAGRTPTASCSATPRRRTSGCSSCSGSSGSLGDVAVDRSPARARRHGAATSTTSPRRGSPASGARRRRREHRERRVLVPRTASTRRRAMTARRLRGVPTGPAGRSGESHRRAAALVDHGPWQERAVEREDLDAGRPPARRRRAGARPSSSLSPSRRADVRRQPSASRTAGSSVTRFDAGAHLAARREHRGSAAPAAAGSR